MTVAQQIMITRCEMLLHTKPRSRRRMELEMRLKWLRLRQMIQELDR